MARSVSRSDLISGLFGAFIIACLVFVVLFLQAWSPEARGSRYYVRFVDTGGLGGNAPVIVGGQRVGKVESVKPLAVPQSDGSVTVEVDVSFIIDEKFAKTVSVPADTVCAVQASGFFGGTQLVLKLGKSRDIVQPDTRIPVYGTPPVTFNSLLEEGQRTMNNLIKGIDELNKVLNDKEFIEAIRKSPKHLESILSKLDKSMDTLGPALEKLSPALENGNALLKELKDLVERNSKNIDSALTNLANATSNINELLDKEGAVRLLVGDLRAVAGNLDELLVNLNNVVLDNQGNIAVSLTNIKEASISLRTFAKRIEADPSLLIWGTSDKVPAPGQPQPTKAADVDEWALRKSGRVAPRREQD